MTIRSRLAEPALLGKGLATEALAALLRFGFETLGYATHRAANLASGWVMLHYYDLWQYRLTSQEYAELGNSENNHAAY